ncbi:CRISPR-associated protein Cas4 [bacterium]|nr:MAG: CRISPR-associated protein Cas4 [bacterium]
MESKRHSDDDLLMLSGIQHIAFCERQWGLIHIEQQWEENLRTVEGHHLHERVDDPLESDTRKDVAILRAVPLISYRLGLSGTADVIEFYRTDGKGVVLLGHSGKWYPHPVEYKRGKPKPDDRDRVQLCAQAMCLEEMYTIQIPKGALFYGETRHRETVDFCVALRSRVNELASRMHELFQQGITPSPIYKNHCKSCSLIDICLPLSIQRMPDVNQFLANELEIFD